MRPRAAKYSRANVRLVSFWSQYQGSVKMRPWAVLSHSAWMSLMKISRPASFWPPSTMPNSDACLDRVDGVAAGIGKPDDFGLRGLRLQQERGEIGAGEWVAHFAQHLAAALHHDRFGVALERVAEGVVGGEEEPGIAAALHDRVAGAVRQRPGVVNPMHGVGRARLAGEIGGRRAHRQEHLVLVAGELVDRERDRGGRHVRNGIDLVDVEPLARNAQADVGLVLVIAADDLDLHTLGGGTEILNRLARHPDRGSARDIGVDARLIVEHANLDRPAAILRIASARS